MTPARQALALAKKDLTIEVRAHRSTGAAVPFAGTVLLSFGLALGPGRALLQEAAPGLLWLAVLFGSVLAFRQGYRIEAEDDATEGLVIAPIDKAAVFSGKAVAVAIELLALESIVLVISSALFGLSFGEEPFVLVAALVLGTIGLSAIGSLFGVLAESPRAGEGLLPLLVLPLATPVLLAGVRATAAAAGDPGVHAGSWLGLLAAFDISFLSIGTLVYEQLLEEQ